MTSALFSQFKLDTQKGNHNMSSTTAGTFKCALLSAVGTMTALNVSKYSDLAGVSATEVSSSGTGYTTGGADISAGMTVTQSSGTITVTSSTNPSWGSATFSAVGAIILDTVFTITGSASLVAYLDFGGTKTVTSGTFTITWNASGIYTIA